jgi:hypothetical protein
MSNRDEGEEIVIQQLLSAYSVPCIVLDPRHTKMNRARGRGSPIMSPFKPGGGAPILYSRDWFFFSKVCKSKIVRNSFFKGGSPKLNRLHVPPHLNLPLERTKSRWRLGCRHPRINGRCPRSGPWVHFLVCKTEITVYLPCKVSAKLMKSAWPETPYFE